MGIELFKVYEIVRQEIGKDVDIREFQCQFIWDSEQVKNIPNRFVEVIRLVLFCCGILLTIRSPRLLKVPRYPCGLLTANSVQLRFVSCSSRSLTGVTAPIDGTKRSSAMIYGQCYPRRSG
jgi:hypothetical protein